MQEVKRSGGSSARRSVCLTLTRRTISRLLIMTYHEYGHALVSEAGQRSLLTLPDSRKDILLFVNRTQGLCEGIVIYH